MNQYEYERQQDLPSEDEQRVWKLIEEGDHARNAVEEAIDVLKEARNWGIADMLGGKIVVTAIKQQHMSQAKAKLREADRLLRAFTRDLQGYSRNTGLELSTGGLDVLDYLFDNIVIDSLIQSRITQSLNHAQDVSQELTRVLDELGERAQHCLE